MKRILRALARLVRQQVRWWRLQRLEAVPPEPPPRNAYPGLAWDSPLRRSEMEAVRMRREGWA